MHNKSKIPVRCAGHGLADGKIWHIEIEVQDRTGQKYNRLFSMADLARDTNPLWEFLGAAGYVVPQNEKRALQDHILRQPVKSSFNVCTTQGWYGTSFVTPHRLYGTDSRSTRLIRSESADPGKWIPSGRLSRWKRDMEAICIGNPLVGFAVCAAFASPLLELLRLPSIGISYVGEPSLGKSSTLTLAGAVWGGNPGRPLGFCETFSKTVNAFDKVMKRYRGCLLGLDETHLANNKVRELAEAVGAVVHRLAGGETKETALGEALSSYGALLYMMTSNHRLDELFTLAKLPYDQSYGARLIEIPVLKPKGMFDRLPDNLTSHAFAEKITTAAAENYGVAIDAFLEKLTASRSEDEDQLIAWIRRRMSSMSRRLDIDENARGDARVGQYFCLIYSAARLAEKYDILPWDWKTSSSMVQTAYDAHRSTSLLIEEEPDLVGEVREIIRRIKSKFIDIRQALPSLSDKEFEATAGYLVGGRQGEQFFVFSPKAFHTHFRLHGSTTATLEALSKAGLLHHDTGKHQTKHRVRRERDRDRVYSVSAEILDGAEE